MKGNFRWLLLVLLSAVPMTFARAYDRAPSYQNLVQAKNRVVALQGRVLQLMEYIRLGVRPEYPDGGGGEDEGECREISRARECLASGCQWVSIRDPYRRSSGYCTEEGDRGAEGNGYPRLWPRSLEILEIKNDFAANFALQGMGSGLFKLGEQIDFALLSYGTPAFWQPWSKACQSCRNLIAANQAAKVSARLPQVGLITPFDFEPIDIELQNVKSDLMCP